MAEYHDRIFVDERVVLDGNTFTGCTFDGCTLVFTGEQRVALTANHLRGCQYEFGGPALRTLEFLQVLYHTSDGDRPVMDGIIDAIRAPWRR